MNRIYIFSIFTFFTSLALGSPKKPPQVAPSYDCGNSLSYSFGVKDFSSWHHFQANPEAVLNRRLVIKATESPNTLRLRSYVGNVYELRVPSQAETDSGYSPYLNQRRIVFSSFANSIEGFQFQKTFNLSQSNAPKLKNMLNEILEDRQIENYPEEQTPRIQIFNNALTDGHSIQVLSAHEGLSGTEHLAGFLSPESPAITNSIATLEDPSAFENQEVRASNSKSSLNTERLSVLPQSTRETLASYWLLNIIFGYNHFNSDSWRISNNLVVGLVSNHSLYTEEGPFNEQLANDVPPLLDIEQEYHWPLGKWPVALSSPEQADLLLQYISPSFHKWLTEFSLRNLTDSALENNFIFRDSDLESIVLRINKFRNHLDSLNNQ